MFDNYNIRKKTKEYGTPISAPVSESDSTQATVERTTNIEYGEILREPVERVVAHYSNYGELLRVEVINQNDMHPFDDENNNIPITP